MTLILHAGAKPVDFDQLRLIPTPPATKTHYPLAHADFVSMVKFALGYFGHDLTGEQFGVTEDGMDMFGVLTLKSDYGDYTDVCGLRNSNTKRFPATISVGASCFVCDNLSFVGSNMVKRRHTQNLRRELPALISEMVEPLKEQRLLQHKGFERYKNTPLTIDAADHLVIEAYRKGIVNLQRIPDVLEQFERPAHDWGEPSVWRFFNATTYALAGKIAEAPDLTTRLHQVADSYCEVIH